MEPAFSNSRRLRKNAGKTGSRNVKRAGSVGAFAVETSGLFEANLFNASTLLRTEKRKRGVRPNRRSRKRRRIRRFKTKCESKRNDGAKRSDRRQSLIEGGVPEVDKRILFQRQVFHQRNNGVQRRVGSTRPRRDASEPSAEKGDVRVSFFSFLAPRRAETPAQTLRPEQTAPATPTSVKSFGKTAKTDSPPLTLRRRRCKMNAKRRKKRRRLFSRRLSERRARLFADSACADVRRFRRSEKRTPRKSFPFPFAEMSVTQPPPSSVPVRRRRSSSKTSRTTFLRRRDQRGASSVLAGRDRRRFASTAARNLSSLIATRRLFGFIAVNNAGFPASFSVCGACAPFRYYVVRRGFVARSRRTIITVPRVLRRRSVSLGASARSSARRGDVVLGSGAPSNLGETPI